MSLSRSIPATIVFFFSFLLSGCTQLKSASQIFPQTVPVIPTSAPFLDSSAQIEVTPEPTPTIDEELTVFLKGHAEKVGLSEPTTSYATFGWRIPTPVGDVSEGLLEVIGVGFAQMNVDKQVTNRLKNNFIAEGFTVDTTNTTFTAGSGIISLKKANTLCQFFVSEGLVGSTEAEDNLFIACGHPNLSN